MTSDERVKILEKAAQIALAQNKNAAWGCGVEWALTQVAALQPSPRESPHWVSPYWVSYRDGFCLKKALLCEAEVARYGTTGIHKAAPLVDPSSQAWVSDLFQTSRFRPNDVSYRYVRIAPDLVDLLTEIQQALPTVGATLQIHSAYRPPAYNRVLGGCSESTHIDGLAADISAAKLSLCELHKICDHIVGDRGGVGYAPSVDHVHVDVRGFRARWEE